MNAIAPVDVGTRADVRSGMIADVIVLNDFAHVQGGGSKVAILSAAALAARGYRVLFFAAVAPVDPVLAAGGVEVVCLDQSDMLTDDSRVRAAARGLWNGRAARAFAAVLDTFDPARTIVHMHGWMKALSSSVVREARDRGFRIVSTLHDYSAVCPNGGFFNYRTEQVCTLKPLGVRCLATDCDSRHFGHKAWRVARHLAQQHRGGFRESFDGYIYLSELDRILHDGLLPPGAPLRHVANPIDVKHGPPAQPAGNREFVFAGRLAKEKGPVVFARAACAAGAPAAFVGDGYLGDAVRAAAPEAEITGWLPSAAVEQRLRGARALVFPSLWPETQGLSVREAAALGVPAIVSDACAAREAIEDGVTGLLFRSGDVDDLRRQIERCRDDALVARLGRDAYDRFWAAPSTLDAHADALERLYGDVLGEGARGG